MATYLGNQTLNADVGTPGNRAYTLLKFRSGRYQWSPVFVTSPSAARARAPLATLERDGWLFAYFNGDWLKVWGT